ncbi:MAG: benzil reductase ((S)-benzoin forming) [Methyloprofundus sp.]|nr:MAG: benzil reductase ((S)-benzoin forming) [Methyloprofundus sp.]
MIAKNALITGNSNGLGKGLTQALLNANYHVYGCSRQGCSLTGKLNDIRCDLSDFDSITTALQQLLAGITHLDLVILNAGILGELKNMSATSLDELQTVMNINVWANKFIFDYLLESGIAIKQILLMSSGAAVLGNKGWGAYALSKSALNMLGRLYAHEFPDTHIMSIAPGLVDSQMMDYLCNEADSTEFPALQRIQQAKKDDKILSIDQAAVRILSALPHLKDYESGSFIDLRQILAPEEYAELMQARNKP